MEKLLNEVKQYRKEQAELIDWNKNNGHPIMVSYDEGGLNACDKIIAIIERVRAKADSTSEKDLRVCEVIASASLIPMEGILNDAMKKEAKYSVQFADYDMDTWTAPVVLTENRKDKVLTDGSIRKIRIEYEN